VNATFGVGSVQNKNYCTTALTYKQAAEKTEPWYTVRTQTGKTMSNSILVRLQKEAQSLHDVGENLYHTYTQNPTKGAEQINKLLNNKEIVRLVQGRTIRKRRCIDSVHYILDSMLSTHRALLHTKTKGPYLTEQTEEELNLLKDLLKETLELTHLHNKEPKNIRETKLKLLGHRTRTYAAKLQKQNSELNLVWKTLHTKTKSKNLAETAQEHYNNLREAVQNSTTNQNTEPHRTNREENLTSLVVFRTYGPVYDTVSTQRTLPIDLEAQQIAKYHNLRKKSSVTLAFIPETLYDQMKKRHNTTLEAVNPEILHKNQDTIKTALKLCYETNLTLETCIDMVEKL